MNYYEILGVDRKAYMSLARKWHPDLSDEVARLDYDKKLDAAANQSARQKKSSADEPKTSQKKKYYCNTRS